MNTHVFFDLDRTLWHHEKNAQEVLAELGQSHVPLQAIASEHLASAYQEINDGLWDIIQSAGYSVDYVRNRRFPMLLERFVPFLSTLEKRTIARHLEEAFTEQMPDRGHSYPGVREALTLLHTKGYILHILTNGVLASQARKVAALKLDIPFATHTTSDMARAYKPDQAIFRFALNAAGCSADVAVMVGDSLLRDVAGGKAVGMKTLWFQAPDALPPDGDTQPDGVFTHFDALPAALKSLCIS